MTDFTLQPGSAHERDVTHHLSAAASQLNLPAAFAQQLKLAVSESAQMTFEHEQADSVRVSVRVMQASDPRASHSWGFFLIRSCTGEPAQHRIEVNLYQDQPG